MSRPIERLPPKRHSNEPKEAMNCKSCRKRKIKCNRLRPSCGACQVFNCACIYDAVPKKRGPKTDVLESLLKRVNGLERQLKDEHKTTSSDKSQSANSLQESSEDLGGQSQDEIPTQSGSVSVSVSDPVQTRNPAPNPPAVHQSLLVDAGHTDVLVDTYFSRLHAKPFYILDESATRERLRDGVLPHFIVKAIHAVSIRYAPHLAGGYFDAIGTSEELARQSRAGIDIDEPSIDHLQTLLLLSIANHQNGRGKRSYMMLSHAVGMTFALNLHRELPAQLKIAPPEREGRRNLFWTVYLMDRFTASGSVRPSLISDESIQLRLPARHVPGSQHVPEGDYFPNASTSAHASGAQGAMPDSGKMLIEIVRILGITNRYLTAGGVKGDSHFPWHHQSTLSRIRSDLDRWAVYTQGTFASVENLFNSSHTSTLVLSKLVYHVIHCLIYRPFLPVDLAELSGSGQNQSWQVDATNTCFLHANAIVEMIEIGKNSSLTEWPPFISYCVCTAGSVHIHGLHFVSFQEDDVYNHSTDFLSREMALLLDLRAISISAEHQRNTLQLLYTSHAHLVKSLSTNPMRFSRGFQMEDFLDRYSGVHIDGSYITFTDVTIDTTRHNLIAQNMMGFDVGADINQQWPVASDANVYQPDVATGVPYYVSCTGPPNNTRKRKTKAAAPTNTTEVSLQQGSRGTHDVSLRQKAPAPMIESQDTGESGQNIEYGDDPTLAQCLASPNFNLTPLVTTPMLDHQGYDQQTVASHARQPSPGISTISAHTDGEQDPFLSLLEQLGENDVMGIDGPSDFDFLQDYA